MPMNLNKQKIVILFVFTKIEFKLNKLKHFLSNLLTDFLKKKQ